MCLRWLCGCSGTYSESWKLVTDFVDFLSSHGKSDKKCSLLCPYLRPPPLGESRGTCWRCQLRTSAVPATCTHTVVNCLMTSTGLHGSEVKRWPQPGSPYHCRRGGRGVYSSLNECVECGQSQRSPTVLYVTIIANYFSFSTFSLISDDISYIHTNGNRYTRILLPWWLLCFQERWSPPPNSSSAALCLMTWEEARALQLHQKGFLFSLKHSTAVSSAHYFEC